MYAQEMPMLRQAGLSDYDKFADIITFVLLSIKQPFMRIPEHMDETRAKGEKSPYLWGWKRDGYNFLRTETAHDMWNDVKACSTVQATEEVIRILRVVPGLGIVKSAFVAQMLGFNVACFDSRNAKILGHGGRKWRQHRASAGLLAHRIKEYVEESLKTGGAEYWWNSWCIRVAEDNYETPERVSRLHLAAIRKGVR